MAALAPPIDAIRSLLAVGWIALTALAIGARLLGSGRLQAPPVLERVLQCALGLGLLAYGVFALGLAGLLYGVVLAGGLLALTWLLRREIRDQFAWVCAQSAALFCRYRRNAWLWVPLLLALAALAFPLIYALAPEVAFDSVCFYSEYARENLKAHRILFFPNLRATHQPFTPVQLFELGMELGGAAGAKLIHFLFFVLLALWVYGLGRLGGRKSAYIGLLLFISIPVLQWEAAAAMIDLPHALFALCALTLVLLRPLNTHTLVASGLFFGLALASKHQASFFGPFLLVLLAVRVRDFGWRRGGGKILLFFLTALVVVAPWYLKSYLQTGNPVFPLAQRVFQSPYLNRQIVEIEDAERARFGLGKGAVAAALLPVRFVTQPTAFRGSPGALAALALPLLWLVLLRRRTVDFGIVLVLVAVAYGYTALWFVTVQEIRFLVPVMPIYAVLLGLLLRPGASRPASLTVLAGLTLYAVCYLPPVYTKLQPAFELRLNADSLALQTVLGRVDKDTYIARDFPSIYVYRYINEHLPADAYVMSGDGAAYYCDRPFLYTFSKDGTYIFEHSDAESIARRSVEKGVTHAVFDLRYTDGNDPAKRMLDELREKFMDRVYAANDVELFKFRGQGLRNQSAINPQSAIRNPQFPDP
ncbi:MAG: ArnT family glycosyltransferase [Acidobacteriota bacterium]